MLYFNLVNKEGTIISELAANHDVTVEEALELIGIVSDPSCYSIIEVTENKNL